MGKDFLITRILLGIAGFIVIIWSTLWLLDHRSPTSSQPTRAGSQASPFLSPVDSTGADFSETTNNSDNELSGGL